jgi:NAD kinase
MGPDCDPIRKVYQGDQLEKFELVEIKEFHVLNEVVLDRGPSPYSIQLNI